MTDDEKKLEEIEKRVEWHKNLRPDEKLLADRGLAGRIAEDDRGWLLSYAKRLREMCQEKYETAREQAWIDSINEAQDYARALERENVQLQAELGKMREAVIRNHNSDQKDYACFQCDPHSEVLISGFQCAYHTALAAKEGKV